MKKILLVTTLLLAVGGSLMAQNKISVKETQTATLNPIPATVTSLGPVGEDMSGPIISGMYVSVDIEIPYQGGNGGQTPHLLLASEDVTGLELTINSQTLNNGDGRLVGTVRGIASDVGFPKFNITIGGQSYEVFFYAY